MATVKLGAMITAISGSVGGSTFRRTQGSTVMYNRPRGASKSRLLLNKALSQLRGTIQGWAALTQSVRDDWSTATALFLFPDKFGVMRSLNPRMFYIKLTARLKLVGLASPDPNTLDSTVIVNKIISASIISAGVKTLEMDVANATDTYILQIERVKNDSITPTFTRRKMLKHQVLGVGVDIVFTTEFNNRFPNSVAGEHYILYVIPQNPDGFRAVSLPIKIITT